MTDDELDLLASAYVDGEATPEEVALVERDPELLARVEEFRALDTGREPVTAPAGLAERHLTVAMAEFALGSGAAQPDVSRSGPAPVVDLGQRRSSRAGRRARPPRGLPTWLPAAAAFILIGGGVVWALGRAGGGDDDTMDTAAAEFDGGDESADEEASQDAVAAESAVMADEAGTAEESADDSLDAVAAAPENDEDQERATDGGSDATADDGEEEAMATTTMVGPLPPLVSFDSIPDLDTVTDLPEPLPDLAVSRCGPEVVTPALGEAVGFVPVQVAGEPAEVFVFVQGDGTELRLLFDGNCQPLEP